MVDGRKNLKELVDALLIVEVSKLLKGLLDLLTKSLRLMGGGGGKTVKRVRVFLRNRCDRAKRSIAHN